MYRIFLHTLMNFHEFIIICAAKYDEYWTVYKLLTVKNHMTQSLLTVYSVKCQYVTICDISMDFRYGAGCTQCVYTLYTLFINKMPSVC